MDEHLSLDPNDPAVLSVLLDTEAMQVWECLRQLGGRVTLAAVVKATDLSAAEVAGVLDRLAAVGLVRVFRAQRGQRAPTYGVTSNRLSIQLTPGRPESKEVIARFAEVSHRQHADLVAKTKPMQQVGGPDVVFGEVHALLLDADDLRELRRRLGAVAEFLELHSQRPREPVDGVIARCNYMVSVQMAPLAKPVLPSPVVAVNAVEVDPSRPRGSRMTNAMLSSRELHVARELRDGRTRSEIAVRLRVSPNTVHTHCKRIFKKLGIERASELHRFALHPLQEQATPAAARAPMRPAGA